MADEAEFEGWAILELMGHRRLAGYLSPAKVGGQGFVRIDVPGEDGPQATQFYSPGAVYCITPTTEELARQVGTKSPPAPVARWELPAARDAEPDDDDDEVDYR